MFKNIPLKLAVAFVGLVIILAVFAHSFIIDKTPMSNRMTIELGAQTAGFQQQFLLVPKEISLEQKTSWKNYFTGMSDMHYYIPINDVLLQGQDIIALHYVDEGIQDSIRYSLSDFRLQTFPKDIKEFKDAFTTKIRYPLGTDRYGRDLWSRLVLGARVSLSVGLVAVLLSISIGLFMGAIAGWYGGWVDNVIMYFVNILWAIPTLLLVFAVSLSIGKGFWEIFIAIGLTSWVGPARMIRGQVMQAKTLDYVTAARTLGYSDFRILFKHILPNIAGPIMVIAAANFATAILVEAGLSFLGIGVQPPMPSWGLMIKEHYNFLIAGKPMVALIPGLAILLLVLSLNIIGNALRDRLDVRNEQSR